MAAEARRVTESDDIEAMGVTLLETLETPELPVTLGLADVSTRDLGTSETARSKTERHTRNGEWGRGAAACRLCRRELRLVAAAVADHPALSSEVDRALALRDVTPKP
jgi:hypothetical protein